MRESKRLPKNSVFRENRNLLFFGSRFFQFGAFRFEFFDGCGGCTACHTLRNQEVACIAVLDLDDITQIAEIADFFQQNNLHFFLQYSLD